MGPKVSTILNNPLVYQHKYDEQICLCLERYRFVYSLHAANLFMSRKIQVCILFTCCQFVYVSKDTGVYTFYILPIC